MSWYYQKGQRAYGPLSKEQLVAKLKLGECGFFDKVSYDEGAWTYIYECHELGAELAALKLDQNKEWIVLKDEKLQLGPFNLEQLVAHIKSGAVSYSDFIWKEGLTQWVPISRLDDVMNLSPKAILADIQEGTGLLDSATLSGVTKEPIKQPGISPVNFNEALPEEVDGVDLVPQAWELVAECKK